MSERQQRRGSRSFGWCPTHCFYPAATNHSLRSSGLVAVFVERVGPSIGPRLAALDFDPAISRGASRMIGRRWARKELQPGDFSALRELSKGWGVPGLARLNRLSDRGFVEKREGGKVRVTMKGRAALLLGRR